MTSFILHPVAPFRLDYTVAALRRLPVNEMDSWDGRTYRRAIIVDNKPVEVSVVQSGSHEDPKLNVTVRGLRPSEHVKTTVAAALEKLLGLSIDLTDFFRMTTSDPRLASLVERFAGLKPPRFPTVFEALLNGISCQQITLTLGIRLLNRLAATYGLSIEDKHVFPRPEDLSYAEPSHLRYFGYRGRKAENMIWLAREVEGGGIDLGVLSCLNDEEVITRLMELPGIGRWTAQYVALRGLGRLDTLPADDVGSQAKMQKWLGLEHRPDYDEMYRIVNKWAPYRGLIYFYLLLDNLDRQGLLQAQGKKAEAGEEKILVPA